MKSRFISVVAVAGVCAVLTACGNQTRPLVEQVDGGTPTSGSSSGGGQGGAGGTSGNAGGMAGAPGAAGNAGAGG